MRITTYFFFCLLLSLVACSKKSEVAKRSSDTSQETVKVDPATAATISGVVKFSGTPPKPQKMDMCPDPACGSQPTFDESYVVNNGDLANVFVYVKSS